jgi:hypothetical protein
MDVGRTRAADRMMQGALLSLLTCRHSLVSEQDTPQSSVDFVVVGISQASFRAVGGRRTASRTRCRCQNHTLLAPRGQPNHACAFQAGPVMVVPRPSLGARETLSLEETSHSSGSGLGGGTLLHSANVPAYGVERTHLDDTIVLTRCQLRYRAVDGRQWLLTRDISTTTVYIFQIFAHHR